MNAASIQVEAGQCPDEIKCPVCRNINGSSYNEPQTYGSQNFACECTICGRFDASPEAYNWLRASKNTKGEPKELTEITTAQRALISHKLKISQQQEKPFLITNEWLEHLISEVNLPNPMIQAKNIIRFIGDEVSHSGEPVSKLPKDFHAIIGSNDMLNSIPLIRELESVGLIKTNGEFPPGFVNLTLDGWERYEGEKRGDLSANQGFIAMKFSDPDLDCFVNETVKPAVREIGYDLVDMRDVARAGVIDNIMRAQIRISAFVIADLTHDNSGAYWEAGYAEGLGKPVIYICEKTKFEDVSTHFDTNHCTTVRWSKDDPDSFCRELIATLRRSLDQR